MRSPSAGRHARSTGFASSVYQLLDNEVKLAFVEVTSKKLWVAAIDINGYTDRKLSASDLKRSDPSHPPFYLPAQELVAGNSRGFWVLDPCHENGQDCGSGDQCCEGFCRAEYE